MRDLHKTFRVPGHKVDTLKERVVAPFADRQFRTLRALRGVSFDVLGGEFFGVVGRNGSGKSTLLKVLSSIYRADSGSVRVAGRLAPFIELGVGFNMELTARENVSLNGVMMGLSRREAAARLGAVLEFAELGEFVDLKLKNYSSGMLVRLAFAVMVEADADVMLIDEVLAVGDAAFAQKCMDVFRAKRAAGKTLVLVTHDMATVQGFCDRALVLHDGQTQYIGDPEEAALRYYRLNFGGSDEREMAFSCRRGAGCDRAAGGRLARGPCRRTRVQNVEQGQPIGLNAVFEARDELVGPVFSFQVLSSDGTWVFGFEERLGGKDGARVAAGARVRIAGTVENPLLPGRYRVECWVSRVRPQGDMALHVLRLTEFLVYGTRPAWAASPSTRRCARSSSSERGLQRLSPALPTV